MKISKKELTLENGTKREWLITNGIGGYSSSTVIGINTRKYHGLLIAPLSPPAMRYLILSKVDESITIKNKKYDLYSNMCRNYTSEGYKYQEEFEKDYIPIFTYKVEDILIKKLICMEHGKNTVCILYKIENKGKKAKLTITPVVNFRDFHAMSTNHNFEVKQEVKERKVRLEVDGNSRTPIYIYASDGEYSQHINDKFNNMFYIEEENRGFFPEEDHSVPGSYEIEVPENSEREISFVCSLEENIEEIDARKVINREIERINEILYDTKLADIKQDITNMTKEELKRLNLLRDFIIAADNFVVYRPNFGLHTIIAGYPWFLDWGRDSLISIEGLLLLTKRFDIAKEVLLTIVRDIKFGLVPNGYSEYNNEPIYNSVDSSLLLFEAVYQYLEYTEDYKFIEEEIYEKLEAVCENYRDGIDFNDNNIYLDKDYLISAGTPNTQNTWMDAEAGGFPVTPRNGKAVEINAMWYNSLKILEELSIKFGKKKTAKEAKELAEKCKISFEQKFYTAKRKSLYDVLGDNKIRPNQLFALGLSFPVLEPNSDMAHQIFDTVTKKLLNKYGLKTLAKGEKGYIDTYEGDAFRRDSSYHQGITWPWLLGEYYNALRNMIKAEKNRTAKKELEKKLEAFDQSVKDTFAKAIYEDDMLGSISEIYDSKNPQLPKGAPVQAWSVAEVFRIILAI